VLNMLTDQLADTMEAKQDWWLEMAKKYNLNIEENSYRFDELTKTIKAKPR